MRNRTNTKSYRYEIVLAQRIRIADQLQNLTGSSSTDVLARVRRGYPLQNRRHFYIEFSNIKYNLLTFLITVIYQ
jgi:hypothetical protein